MGFFQICAGVVLLQMSKSAKDVPDAAVFKGDLDQVREIAEVEQPETEPKADAIRGAAALVRRFSTSRQKWEQEEARRLREDKMKDQLEPVRENEIIEWDGLRRRKTVIGEPGSPIVRRKTLHPPLGMSRFPEPNEDSEVNPGPGFFENLRNRAQTASRTTTPLQATNTLQSPIHPVALTEIKLHPSQIPSPIVPYGPGSLEDAQERIYGLAPGERREQDKNAGIVNAQPSPRSKPLPAKPTPSPILRPPHEARRQFSFTNFLRPGSRTPSNDHPTSRPALQTRSSSASHEQKRALKAATEEERLGLVKGDSHIGLLQDQSSHSPERAHPHASQSHPLSHSSSVTSGDEYYPYQYPSPTRQSLSDSDEDDDWQMTTSANPIQPLEAMTPNPQIPMPALGTTSGRQRTSPPRVYQPPSVMKSTPPRLAEPAPIPVPGTMVGGGLGQGRANPAASGHFPTSPTRDRPNRSQSQSPGLHQRDFGPHQARVSEDQPGDDSRLVPASGARARTESPENYDSSRKRYEEQSKREREERRLRAMGRRQSWKPTDPDSGSFL